MVIFGSHQIYVTYTGQINMSNICYRMRVLAILLTFGSYQIYITYTCQIDMSNKCNIGVLSKLIIFGCYQIYVKHTCQINMSNICYRMRVLAWSFGTICMSLYQRCACVVICFSINFSRKREISNTWKITKILFYFVLGKFNQICQLFHPPTKSKFIFSV